MNRLFALLLFYLFFSSCTNKPNKQTNEKYITGDWVLVEHKDDARSAVPDFYMPGFSFYTNHTFDNKTGFFKYVKDSLWGKQYYLGSISKFRLTNDSLFLFRPDDSKWYSYKILELSSDFLKFGKNGVTKSYKRINTSKNETPSFDQIILSTSDCFGPCPVSNTIINANGTVVFEGEMFTIHTGLFTGNIPKEKYDQLQGNFRKIDFDDLKNEYSSGITDMQTICTTFVRDGKIYKSVSDYAGLAPYLFRWGYVPLEIYISKYL